MREPDYEASDALHRVAERQGFGRLAPVALDGRAFAREEVVDRRAKAGMRDQVAGVREHRLETARELVLAW